MTPILQPSLPFTPWLDPALRRMPGIQPVAAGEWLQIDETYSAQLAEKERLIRARPKDVLALDTGAQVAAEELLQRVIEDVQDKRGFSWAGDQITRPDGRRVALEFGNPLVTLSQLVQEDFCILQKRGDEHVLTGALLCFPASWTLSEKFMRPLTVIHEPVGGYDAKIAKRVQRMFDMVRPEQPLWRANALFYNDPTLYQPRTASDTRVSAGLDAPYIRSERQTILRLAKTDAVVFSIHTYQIARESLTAEQAASLADKG